MKRKSVSVSVQKTVQAASYEPVVISVTEVADLEDGEKASEVKRKLYKSASDSLHTFMQEELKLWKRKSKD